MVNLNNLQFCSLCCKNKPQQGFILVEGTGDFINDIPVYFCADCKESAISDIKKLPWKPTFKITKLDDFKS